MVEGPGCKVKGEKLKPRIKGQVVEAITGDVVDKVELDLECCLQYSDSTSTRTPSLLLQQLV